MSEEDGDIRPPAPNDIFANTSTDFRGIDFDRYIDIAILDCMRNFSNPDKKMYIDAVDNLEGITLTSATDKQVKEYQEPFDKEWTELVEKAKPAKPTTAQQFDFCRKKFRVLMKFVKRRSVQKSTFEV